MSGGIGGWAGTLDLVHICPLCFDVRRDRRMGRHFGFGAYLSFISFDVRRDRRMGRHFGFGAYLSF